MRLKKWKKQGVIANFLPMVTGLVAIGIMIVIGFLILAQVAANAKVTADPNATAAVAEVQTAMSDIPGWLPIVVVAVIGVLLLSLVQMFRSR